MSGTTVTKSGCYLGQRAAIMGGSSGFIAFAVLAFLAATAIGFGVLFKELAGGPPLHPVGAAIDGGAR